MPYSLKTHLMTTRNTIVEEKLKGLYSAQNFAARLAIFTVSNEDYWQYREEPKDKAMPYLDLSNIIKLRKYCISTVADSQWTSAQKYMSHEIPALLDSIDVWVRSGSETASAERKMRVHDALEKTETSLKLVSEVIDTGDMLLIMGVQTLHVPAHHFQSLAGTVQYHYEEHVHEVMGALRYAIRNESAFANWSSEAKANEWSQSAQSAAKEWNDVSTRVESSSGDRI